jgi:uncharacterized protein YlbG (UPF0298 family)
MYSFVTSIFSMSQLKFSVLYVGSISSLSQLYVFGDSVFSISQLKFSVLYVGSVSSLSQLKIVVLSFSDVFWLLVIIAH